MKGLSVGLKVSEWEGGLGMGGGTRLVLGHTLVHETTGVWWIHASEPNSRKLLYASSQPRR